MFKGAKRRFAPLEIRPAIENAGSKPGLCDRHTVFIWNGTERYGGRAKARFGSGKVHEQLGVRSVINALGSATVLGGSTPTPVVKEAMEQASLHYVEMRELLEKSGDFIAWENTGALGSP
jgi:hypothetical protein